MKPKRPGLLLRYRSVRVLIQRLRQEDTLVEGQTKLRLCQFFRQAVPERIQVPPLTVNDDRRSEPHHAAQGSEEKRIVRGLKMNRKTHFHIITS